MFYIHNVEELVLEFSHLIASLPSSSKEKYALLTVDKLN